MVSAVTLRAARQYGGAVRTRAKRFRALRSVLVPRSQVLTVGERDDNDNDDGNAIVDAYVRLLLGERAISRFSSTVSVRVCVRVCVRAPR